MNFGAVKLSFGTDARTDWPLEWWRNPDPVDLAIDVRLWERVRTFGRVLESAVGQLESVEVLPEGQTRYE